jgi:phosphoglycolate phosphatase-like HAD superfamily hydrolase
MNTVADSLSGIEPSEEEKKKREKDAARTTMTNIVNDIISPFPLLNIPIDAGINNLMNATFQSDTPEDLRFNLYSGEGRKWYDDLGLTGMGIKKVDRTIEMAKEAATGDVKTAYFGKEYVKNIADEDLPMAKAAAVFNALTQVGLLPTDVGSVANKMMKGAEKRSMNATKEESYREIRGEGATEIDPKSKNINADISRVVSITDPEAKANYLIKIAKKYGGQALSDAINSIREEIGPEFYIYIGDETRDIDAAHRANIPAIACTWGLHTQETLEKSKPTYFAQHPLELIQILNSI